MCPFGRFLYHLGWAPSGSLWFPLASSGSLWLPLVPSGSERSDPIPSGSEHSDPIGSVRIRSDPFGHDRILVLTLVLVLANMLLGFAPSGCSVLCSPCDSFTSAAIPSLSLAAAWFESSFA